jgi:translation initiation factor 3 subunit F
MPRTSTAWNLPKKSNLKSRCIPSNVTIHPVALISILDHYLRRTDEQPRVIGTLLGTRSDSEVHVRSSFPVLHSETSERVAVDKEYLRTVYDLHLKVNPKEVIVGWYAFFSSVHIIDFHARKNRYSTGSNLNTYSALIQNFYSQETAPHPSIHVALNTGVEDGGSAGIKAYVR